MRCFKCGAELLPGARFCTKCGEDQGFSEELIGRAKSGDQDAIAELYHRTYNNVYFTVKALIRSEDTILDIVQDSYVKGFQNLSQLQDPDKYRAWMKKIAHNRAVDYLRKTKPVIFSTMSSEEDEMVEFEDDRTENLPELVIDQKETTRLIKEILDSLSEDQRLVVGMFYYERMSVKEIAETLQISENTVKSRLSYGRKKIEIQVKELEKRGTKLYSLAPLPFLLLLFKSLDVQAAEVPNGAVLQAIQQACSTSPSGVANHASPNNVSYAAKAASSKAAGAGITAKIIAAVLAVGIIGGGVAGVVAFNANRPPEESSYSAVESVENSGSELPVEENTPEPVEGSKAPVEQEVSEEPQKETENMAVDEEAVYQSILDEYAAAIAQGYFEEGSFQNVSQVMMQLYYQSGGYYMGFYYDFYDIDSNGVKELLISSGSQETYFICDVYGIKDNKPYKLIDEYSLGERSQLYIYPDGEMILFGSGGAALNGIEIYRWNENGEPVSVETETYEGAFDLNAVLDEKSNHQQLVEDFDWKPIEAGASKESQGDAASYIGNYMNGNDWNAGMITITEGEEKGTVIVTLQAFRTRSDMELSDIFRGIGRLEGDELVIEIDGEKAATITKAEYGFYLTPEPAFEQEWNLDPYVFEGMYVSR